MNEQIILMELTDDSGDILEGELIIGDTEETESRTLFDNEALHADSLDRLYESKRLTTKARNGSMILSGCGPKFETSVS